MSRGSIKKELIESLPNNCFWVNNGPILSDLQELLRLAKIWRFEPGELILTEGTHNTWLFYLVLLAALIATFNGLAWIDGTARLGTFELYRSSVPFYPLSVLALMHYLNQVARRSLAAFRPALEARDTDYKRLEYELMTLPRRGILPSSP